MTRRAVAVPAFAAVVLLFTPVTADAVVSGSPHDLAAQGYDVPKEGGGCVSCHLPASVDGRNYLRDIPPSLKDYDARSVVCFSCHDGITLVDVNVDASFTAFHPLSHGYDLTGSRVKIPDDGRFPESDGKRMSCLACHDPHDNTQRPFLVVGLDELCVSCHAEEGNLQEGKDQATINHPLMEDFQPGGSDAVPLVLDRAFKVPFPVEYPVAAGRNAQDSHWKLGGHLDEGDTGLLTCVTCHTVHGDEASPPREMLLAVDPVNERANEFCEACHRGERGDGNEAPPFPNPGGTSTARTYHPVDDISREDRTPVEVRKPAGWPYGSGSGGAMLCTTCHAPHGARIGTAILRETEAPDFCEECHETMPLEYHHPLTSIRCSENFPDPAYGGTAGTMYCSTCHRAHNAGLGESDENPYVPLLRQRTDTEEYCSVCHPLDNPTCGTNPASRASHFLGDPTLPETYDDPNPPLRRDPWKETGLLSTYGGEDKMTITCLSCHSFSKGAVLSGDDGKSAHLVARSGNNIEWEPGNEGTYLCAGCHSANPATRGAGSSHPYMDADASNLLNPPEPPATVTPGGHVNCDSCHRPHEAVTGAGTYILEVITGENTDPAMIHPKIDYTVLCHKCHDASKY